MKDYGLRYRGVIFSTCAVLLVSFFSLSAAASPTGCPKPGLVRYDRTQARFVAQGTAGLEWHSEELAVLSPVPALTAESPVAVGKANEARVVCRYVYAIHNRVILLPQDSSIRFELADPKAWTGNDRYFICKTTDCRFSQTQPKDTKKR